jgi:hypothetical protein
VTVTGSTWTCICFLLEIGALVYAYRYNDQ